MELYDKDFTVEYTEENEVITYYRGVEVASKVVNGLKTERELQDVAISLLAKQYKSPEYIGIVECAEMLGIVRGTVHWIIKNQLIANYHYIAIGNKRFLKPEGIKAIEEKLKEKESD